jgi:hypothetical protein
MNYGSRHTVDKQANDGVRSREQRNARAPSGVAAAAGQPNRAHGHALNGGTPLDPRVRADMETRFGSNFEDVRIHDTDDARRSAAQLDAKAYTVSSDITFSKDRYAPHTAEGKRLIAHELAHVVQQRRGGSRVDGATRPPLESDAATAADAVASGASRVNVNGASSAAVMLDRDDARKKKSRDRLEDDDGGYEKKSQRDAAKRSTQERKQQRASAGKEDAQLSRERADKKVRGLERDAKAPGAKHRATATKQKDLKRYGRAQENASGTQLEKNQRSGAFDEAQRTPSNTAGKPQDKYVAGGPEVPGQELRPGMDRYTQPDYSIYRTVGGKTERLHVNLKSNKIHLQTPAKARATAKYNTDQAIRNSAHLPADESIIISYGHTPSPAVKQAILEQHFGTENPISEVRFGTATHTRAGYAADQAKFPSQGKPKGKSSAAGKAKGTGKGTGKGAKKGAAKPAAGSGSKAKAGKGEASKAKASTSTGKGKNNAAGKAKAKSEVEGKAKAQPKSEGKAKGKSRAESHAQTEARPKAEAQPESKTAKLKKAAPKAESKAAAEKPVSRAARPDQKSPTSHTTPTTENTASSRAAAGSKGVPDAATIEAPKVSAPVEAGAAPTLGSKVRAPLGTVVEAAGWLAVIPAVKSIAQDIKDKNYLPALGKSALLRLSFVSEAAPPLAALGVGLTYWGERHEEIEGDSNETGGEVQHLASKVPLLRDIPYAPEVLGATTAAIVSVDESIYYTAADMVGAVGEGAKDAYDWLTEPILSDEAIERLLQNERD